MLIQVLREDNVTECFISERFVQSQEWVTYRHQMSCPDEIRVCDYNRDYVKYNGERHYPETRYSLKFSEIIHATHQSELLLIINDGGLRPGRKSIPNCTLDSFVWFGMKIGLPEVDALKRCYTMDCKMNSLYSSRSTDNSAAIDCSSIVNSPCFEPMSRYGEFKLTFEIRNVIDAYMRQFCRINQETGDYPRPDFRILGTFIYRMEIMHTVLVCPPDTPFTSKYPLLSSKEKPVICENRFVRGAFTWSPDSTGDKDTAAKKQDERGPFRRWEHVTFAFYVPAGNILRLDDVSSHISVCIYVNPSAGFAESSIANTIKKFLDKVSEESAIETKRCLVNLLIRSLRGYLDEEKVFQDMNILYTYQPLYLGTVVNRVEELLGEKFCWSPFIEWMKDMQQTKNTDVLLSIFKYLNKMTKICTTKLEAMASYND